MNPRTFLALLFICGVAIGHTVSACRGERESCSSGANKDENCCAGFSCKKDAASDYYGACAVGTSGSPSAAPAADASDNTKDAPAPAKPSSDKPVDTSQASDKPASSGKGGSLTEDEFNKAFTANKYGKPDSAHYKAFSSDKVLKLANLKPDDKAEMAMFLTHVIHETGGLQFLEEKNGATQIYDWANPGTHPNPKKSYHGRGPLQISHPQNYHDASQATLGTPDTLINDPDQVYTNKQTGWLTAGWYWGSRVGTSPLVKDKHRFGTSLDLINGEKECRGQKLEQTANRKKKYEVISKEWAIEGTPNTDGCN